MLGPRLRPSLNGVSAESGNALQTGFLIDRDFEAAFKLANRPRLTLRRFRRIAQSFTRSSRVKYSRPEGEGGPVMRGSPIVKRVVFRIAPI